MPTQFRDINPAPMNPAAYYDMVAGIDQNFLAGQQRGMENALLQNELARDMATRNALAEYFAVPEDQRSQAFNVLAGHDPQLAASVLGIQSTQAEMARRQAEAARAEQREQALEQLRNVQWVKRRASEGASAAQVASLLDSDGSLTQMIHNERAKYDVDQDGELSDEEVLALMDDLEAYWGPRAAVAPGGDEAFTLGPGQARFVGGQMIASMPNELSAETSLFAKLNPSDYTPESVAAFQASGGRDFSLLRTRESNERPEIGYGEVRATRNDLIRNSSSFLEQQRGFQNVLAAASDPSPAGDLALLFGVMKVLDPGSIVREGEVQLTEGAGSLAQRVAGQFKRTFQGERLTDAQRQDFLNMAESQFTAARTQQERLITDARKFAERNKLSVEDVVPEFVIPMSFERSAGSRSSERGPAQRAGAAVEQLIDGAVVPTPATRPPAGVVQRGNVIDYGGGVTLELID